MTTTIATAACDKGWVKMRGDSMSPTIKPGEWVKVDPNVTAFVVPGIYLTAWKNFEPTPHYPRQVPQIRRLDYINGELHSIGDNPFLPPFRVNVAALLIGGKIASH